MNTHPESRKEKRQPGGEMIILFIEFKSLVQVVDVLKNIAHLTLDASIVEPGLLWTQLIFKMNHMIIDPRAKEREIECHAVGDQPLVP